MVTNLAILVPFSLYEICYIQKFKVDRLFLFTCLLYSSCFALRLSYLSFFEDQPTLSSFEINFLVPFVQTLQGMACLCLTDYILIIEFVKITIQSMSPQILNAATKSHTRFTWGILSFLFLLLIAQNWVEAYGMVMEHSILFAVYSIVITFLCLRFFWIANYFI